MINIAIGRDARGSVCSFRVEGHAGYAPHGSDIVCAGVSALTQGVIYSLRRLLKVNPEVNVEEGRLLLTLGPVPSEVYEKCVLLLEATVIGLKEIARSYPEYVKIDDFDENE